MERRRRGARPTERRRRDWARSYLASILTRNLREIADIERMADLPRFVSLLAEYSGQRVNYSTFAAGIGVNHKTAQRYLGLLEQVFLITTLRPWHGNQIKRLVKASKLHFLDSGILAAARDLNATAAPISSLWT